MDSLYFLLCTHPTLSKHSPTKTSLVKISKSTGGHVPCPPDLESNQAPTIKPEPLDEDEDLHCLCSSSAKKSKEKPVIWDMSPIVISSDESNAPTTWASAKSVDNLKICTCDILSISVFFLMPELSATLHTKKGGKASSPVILSSNESKPPTPRDKVVKIDNAFYSDMLKKTYM